MAPNTALLLAGVLLAVPLAAGAQSYRCVGKDGKKYYGSTIPPQCAGQTIEQLNAQGAVVKRIDPAADAKERADREATAARKRDDEAAAKDAARRDRALLATYQSEKDIDDARARALADNERVAKDIESRIDALKKRRTAAKGKDEARNAELDIKAQEDLLAAKRREADGIKARYDDDRKRYLEITKGK